jgi:hypothetical protein
MLANGKCTNSSAAAFLHTPIVVKPASPPIPGVTGFSFNSTPLSTVLVNSSAQDTGQSAAEYVASSLREASFGVQTQLASMSEQMTPKPIDTGLPQCKRKGTHNTSMPAGAAAGGSPPVGSNEGYEYPGMISRRMHRGKWKDAVGIANLAFSI